MTLFQSWEQTDGRAMYLYCKTDRRENPFAAQNKLFNNKRNSGAAKDWNDSGGQRPAIIKGKSKKEKGKKTKAIQIKIMEN